MSYRFQLKDGRRVEFYELRKQDLPEMMEVFNSVIMEDAYFPRKEGLPDLETAKQWYQDHKKTGLFYLAARVDDDFVGGATIEPRTGKASHIAYFGMYLRQQFRGIGIGTQLLRRIIEIAKDKEFEKMQLNVFSSNPRALKLYEEFGFQEAGRTRNGIKFPNGTYTDEIIMVLDLKP